MRDTKSSTGVKISKNGRGYSTEVKRKIVSEINAGFLSHRAASRKYGIDRKSVDSWVSQLSLLNLKPLELANNVMVELNDESKTKILAKQVFDLSKELEKAKLKISSLESLIEVSEQDLHIKIRKKPGTKQWKG